MLFWIFVAILILGIAGLVMYNNTSVGEWCFATSFGMILVGIITVVISLSCLGSSHFGVDGKIAANQARYESLVYQYENDLYDNDNDLGKKELMNEIREWNEDLARHQKIQDDFWIGIFYPNIFDQFEFIELKSQQ